jgi:DNA-binding NtrC family response regulator
VTRSSRTARGFIVVEVLIVQDDVRLAGLWARRIAQTGAVVTLAPTPNEATEALRRQGFDALVIDLAMAENSALAVADFAMFRQPEAPVTFVTRDATFADGSILAVAGNAGAIVPADTPPEDLAAIVEYHAAAR